VCARTPGGPSKGPGRWFELLHPQRLESHLQDLQDREEVFLEPIFEVPDEKVIILDAAVR